MAALCIAPAFFLALCFEWAAAGTYCYFSGSYFSSSNYRYCAYGCCSTSCCSYDYDDYYDSALAVWIIVVIVIGCIVGVSVIVAVICCCIKSKGSTGRVVHPAQPTSGVNVVSTNSMQQSNTAWGQPGPYGPPPYAGPPGYTQQYGFTPGQPAPPPPAYSDPANPPGQSNAPPFAAAANNA